jgi:hypothetical protein
LAKSGTKPIATLSGHGRPKRNRAPKRPEDEIRGRPSVIGYQQRGVEIRPEVERRDAREQEAGDGELLGEDHQSVDRAGREQATPRGEIARPGHEEDRQDDGQDV